MLTSIINREKEQDFFTKKELALNWFIEKVQYNLLHKIIFSIFFFLQ